MGCITYRCGKTLLHFSQADEVSCLCTFPHNAKPTLTRRTLRSLVMLGAGAAIAAHYQGREDEYYYLPNSLPDWIKTEIDRLLPVEDNDDPD